MTIESTNEISTSETFFSKLYQKTDGVFAKVILIIGLSGGPIAMFFGYFLWGWGEESFAGLAIPFTIYFGIAFILITFRLIYSRRDKTRKSFKERLTSFSDEEVQDKLNLRTILLIILWIILAGFVVVAVVLTAISRSPFYLTWIVPGIFPGIFLVIEYKQIQQIKEEMEKRQIIK